MQTVKHRMPVASVPRDWRIDRHWHPLDAVLLRATTGSTESIYDMFPKQPEKVQDATIDE
eukprot:7026746-Lingulodinium_polyedra.AAC.1